MKVGVLVSCYNRKSVLERSLWLLERQDWSDYEIWILDDGSTEDIESICDSPLVNYVSVRQAGAPARSPNMAWWAGYELCDADFIILSHPEIMVPQDAIYTMVKSYNGHRSVPLQYAIPPVAQRSIDFVDWWSNLDNLKALPGFWSDMGPWGFTNHRADGWRHHFSFTGQYRYGWNRYGFLPKTEEPGDDDCWMLAQESSRQIFPNPIDLGVYHQHHERLELQDPEESWEENRNASVRIRRIRNAN